MVFEVIKPNLVKKLTDVLLNDPPRGTDIPVELAKKIIYIWRNDSLMTDEGIELLTMAAACVNPETVSNIYEEFGLKVPLLLH